jgi:hypothetical protein
VTRRRDKRRRTRSFSANEHRSLEAHAMKMTTG